MSKLNVQGLARREKRLMDCLVVDPGHVFVSVDLSAGEPTVTTHFSKDPYYMAATFGMVDKEPYYDEQGVLMIDDIYLMTMSVSPIGKARMREVFESTFDGKTFQQQWLEDKEVIQKKVLKDERAFHKILCLGLGYSMGPKHMVEAAFKAGHTLSLKDARAFFKAYWSLFKGVQRLGQYLESAYSAQKYLVNPFGYRLYPEPSYKALNYYIQSSVSGIINMLCVKYFTVADYCKFVTVIHDEIIFQVPVDRLAEAKETFNRAVDSLNEDLSWSVKIRCGWVEGKTLYEAK